VREFRSSAAASRRGLPRRVLVTRRQAGGKLPTRFRPPSGPGPDPGNPRASSGFEICRATCRFYWRI
jgi:hypothetical protein